VGLGKGKIKRRCSGVGEVLEVVMARDDSLVATELTIVLYICPMEVVMARDDSLVAAESTIVLYICTMEVVMARDDSLVATELTIVLYICIFRDDDGRQPTLR